MDILQELRKELSNNRDKRIRDSAQRFFKEKVKHYGIRSAAVYRISRKYFKRAEGLGKNGIFSLCENLFETGYMEEAFIACDWSYEARGSFDEDDFARFEGWIAKYVNNWATCDTLCNHTVGAFVEKYPKYAGKLLGWARSDNRWMRRAAAVTLIIPAKKGEFLKEAFEISDILLEDKEDLVQKGYGWLLKEESRTRQKDVFNYVMKNRLIMPRIALRYAIEKMPKELRVEAMKK